MSDTERLACPRREGCDLGSGDGYRVYPCLSGIGLLWMGSHLFMVPCDKSGLTGQVMREMETVLGRELPGQIMKAGLRLDLHPMESVRTAVG